MKYLWIVLSFATTSLGSAQESDYLSRWTQTINALHQELCRVYNQRMGQWTESHQGYQFKSTMTMAGWDLIILTQTKMHHSSPHGESGVYRVLETTINYPKELLRDKDINQKLLESTDDSREDYLWIFFDLDNSQVSSIRGLTLLLEEFDSPGQLQMTDHYTELYEITEKRLAPTQLSGEWITPKDPSFFQEMMDIIKKKSGK
jgi:hypothetical protein